MSKDTTTPSRTPAQGRSGDPSGASGPLAFLGRRHTIAPAGYSRWLIPPAALAVHLCIGQVYATSVYKTSLVAHFGASQTAIGVIFSIAIVMLGLSAAVMARGSSATARARRCSSRPAPGPWGSS